VRCIEGLGFVYVAVLLAGTPASALPPISSRDFGTLAVNTATPVTATLTYSISSASLRLAYGKDFHLVGQPVCVGTSCEVTVSFNPTYPGVRQDAVLVFGGDGSLLATTFLHGVGLAPEALVLPGTIRAFAGTRALGNGGDSGLAVKATLSNPQGLTVDPAGNVYIADSLAEVIRKVDGTGTITTVVTGLNTPMGVAVDGAGNLYIADSQNNRVQKSDAISGAITTVAGTGTASTSLGDGGLATQASLNNPADVAVDPDGNLFIADQYHGRIRRVDAVSGIITTVAGGGVPGAGADGLGNGGPAVNAVLNAPSGIALDSDGNLYIADTSDNLIRKVSSGMISVVAGDGNPSYGGDGGNAAEASLNAPTGIRLDAAGNLYIADSNNSLIRQVNGAGIISTVAGQADQFGFNANDVWATQAQLHNPSSVAIDPGGTIYIADQGNSMVRKIVPGLAALNWVATSAGAVSAPQILSIANIGNQMLDLNTFSITGAFLQQSSGKLDCATGMRVPPATSCSVLVSFAPQMAGTFNGSISLLTDSLNASKGSVQSVTLSGVGVGTPPVVAPVSLAFPGLSSSNLPLTQTVTLSNPGASSLQIAAISLTESADFAITSTTCSSSLAPQSSCVVSVTCTPSSPNVVNGTLTFTEYATNQPTDALIQTVSLSIGAPPVLFTGQSADFGSQPRGIASFPVPVNFVNTGITTMNINAVAITGTASTDFQQTNNCGMSLSAGQGCTVWMVYSPTWTSPANAQAALVITDSTPGSPHSVAISGTATGMSQALILVDAPAPNATLSGTTQISGWVISDTDQITSISIAVDGGPSMSGNYGAARPDVCAVFPSRAGCPNVGWAARLVTTQLSDGQHQLRVTAVSAAGNTTVSVPFNVSNLSTPAASLTRIMVDQPGSSSPAVAGQVLFYGWAIDDQSSIQAVNLAVDGVLLVQASYGGSRPDVCAVFKNRSGCPNVGWSAPVDTTALANGTHTLIVTVQTADGRFKSSSSSFTVANAAASKIKAVIDVPSNAPVSGVLLAAGWAFDSDAPLAAVKALVDGVPQQATATVVRPDVCRVYSNPPGCPSPGWRVAIDTTLLSDGPHLLTIIVISSDPHRAVLTRSFSVTNLHNRFLATTNAWIDVPNANSGTLSGTVTISGWAVDAVSGISTVQILIDGVPAGSIQPAMPRPDVCAAFPGTVNCPNVGWRYALDTTTLTDGPHMLEIVATSAQGRRMIRSVPFFCSNAASRAAHSALGVIDYPAEASVVSGKVTVAGWAVDAAQHVTSIAVAVDGVSLGTAQYGRSRPDVCATFSNALDCPGVGWTYSLDSALLANGPHTLQVLATAGQDHFVVMRAFTVRNTPNSMTLCIDSPTAVATYSGSAQLYGWAIDNDSAIESLTASIDGVPVGPAFYGVSRPDVCSFLGGHAGCPAVGWQFQIDSTRLISGPHSFQLIGRSVMGQETTISVPFSVAN
jgi:sugar lactone lactonase YvrE